MYATKEIQKSTLMSKRSVRWTGLMYLLVIVCAGFSQGYVRSTLVVPDDAAATATNIVSQEGLFRLGLVADLIAFTLDAIISVMFYQMFRPFNKTLAMVSSALRLVAHPAIASLNLLNHYLALAVLGGSDYLNAFDAGQLQSLSLLLMDAHRNGYLIAGAFFGVHCFLLGLLIYQTNMIPKLLGILMIVAATGYWMETFGNFLFPGNEGWLAWVVGICAALGEVELTLYMLIKGVKKSYQAEYKYE
uniref:DUF4386 domain-containing protein n=1 Tax=Roseihalotalea indica TaxID=2867963 RepID=A0AA49GI64_9BACT|nr:DUF4386 domain-containing protein [Tunicatimonas sp. TK19036]